MLDLGVVIVTWNVRDLVVQAIDSLYKDLQQSQFTSFEIVVVDNASEDDTPDAIRTHFPDVTLIALQENLGFGASNNVGIQHLMMDNGGPRAVYLLNPDTIPQAGSSWALYQALFAASDVGLVGARLSYGDGSFQHSAFMFPGLRQLWAEFFPLPGRLREGAFNGRYSQASYQSAEPFDIDFPLGATMMLKREVIQATEGFDPAFFMYAEEVDWAWRIHKAGWRVQCVPTSHVVHLAGQSTGQIRPQSKLNLWQSRLHLFDKHYPAWKRWIARWMVRQGIQQELKALPQPLTPETAALHQVYLQVQEMTRA